MTSFSLSTADNFDAISSHSSLNIGEAVIRRLFQPNISDSQNNATYFTGGEHGYTKFMSASFSEYDLIHEFFYLIVGATQTVAFLMLLLKLHWEKSALGLSLQSTLALIIANVAVCGLAMVNSWNFASPVRLSVVISHALNAVVAMIVYVNVLRRYKASYEFQRDSFGMSFFNICCLRRRRASYARRGYGPCGLRQHWIVLYIYVALFGAAVQHLRRHVQPTWFGFLECCTDVLTALALFPQLYMFLSAHHRRMNLLLGRFVLFFLFSKAISLVYWVTDVWFHGIFLPGRGIHILSDGANVVILLCFAYYCVLTNKKDVFSDIGLPI